MPKTIHSLITAALLGLGACSGAALAAAPMVRTQAPGYQRLMVGDFEVTALSDGTVKLPVAKLLVAPDAMRIHQGLERSYLQDEVDTSVNAFLVNTGPKLVLIDTGAAGLFGPSLGNLLANLRAAGYQPEQVDEIYITHMHPDHVGGLMAASGRAFPNATLRMDKRDADYWLSEANMNAAPADAKDFFKGAMLSANPYVAAGKLKPFDGATDLIPGVRAQAAYGHTPGHTVYVVESKGQKMVLVGDLIHVASVQLDNPAVTIQFDSDQAAAARQRQLVFSDAAKNGYLIGASHLSFPGIGHLRSSGQDGYTFIPLNYSGLK